tara:strand:+ start:2865 stop:3923 length:1059 start_codon:yes stop_codon:yes gene_type:complete
MSLARDIADLGSVTSRLDTLGGSSGSLGVGRNMLINGDMSVAQREVTSYAVGDADAYKNVDRWKVFAANTAGRATMQQSTDAPSGFTNSLKFSCTTADTSIASNESFGIAQHIEAGTCARTGTGTSGAKQITFSFYAKADSTKTYVVQLLNNKHSSYIHNNRTFTVTSSWQRFTMTFQADTTADSEFDGTLTDAGFSLSFYLHAGSDFTSATLASDWATGTTNRAAGTQSFFSATSNTFFVTGCQLEVGDTVTDFEHRSYGDELARCQRYYIKYGAGGGGGAAFCSNASDTYRRAHITHPVEQRAAGTLTVTWSAGSGAGSLTQPYMAYGYVNAGNTSDYINLTSLISDAEL